MLTMEPERIEEIEAREQAATKGPLDAVMARADERAFQCQAHTDVSDLCAALREALAQVPEWIPVGERLPDDYSKVLVAVNAADLYVTWVAYWSVEHGWYGPGSSTMIGDRAPDFWMPFPDDPQ